MKAICVQAFGDPSVMRLQDLPDPAPGPGQVLVRVRGVGVNPVDTYIRSGNYARKPELPFTPGEDAAGEIVSFGEGWQGRPDLKIGGRVWVCRSTTGTYAQLCVCEATSVCALPEAMTFEQGAAVGVPYLTAYGALHHKARIRPGECVLIHGGSGGVGLAAIQLARAAGCVVIATAGTVGGLELVRREGAHAAINHREVGYEKQVLAASNGRGPDVIVEMLANVNLAKDLEMVAVRGRVVVVGNRGEVTINPRLTMAKDSSVLGISLANVQPQEWAQALWAINEGLANRTLRPIVREVLSLEQAPKAHEMVLASGAMGKIVLRP